MLILTPDGREDQLVQQQVGKVCQNTILPLL